MAVEPVSEAGDDALRNGFETALAEYGAARNTPFGKASPIWDVFHERIREGLEGLPSVRASPTLKVKPSVGRGNWAAVPWVALLDSRETSTTREGIYPAFLFRQDLSGVYLTLAQGVTKPKQERGAAQGLESLRRNAAEFRLRYPQLNQRGFALNGELNISPDPGLGRDYEASVIAHKLYERGQVPPAPELNRDLDVLLQAYNAYLTEQRPLTDDLPDLIEEWRKATGYPVARDRAQIQARDGLALILDPDVLDEVVEDPSAFPVSEFNRFVASVYGSPGSQSRVHQGLQQEGDMGRSKLARALRHVLYGEGDVAERIDDVLVASDWKVYGLGESLVTKALAVVDPARWLPLYQYEGDRGKEQLLNLPELGLTELDPVDLETPGRRAVASNDALRSRLEPLLSGDPWGQKEFLEWLRGRHTESVVTPVAATAPLSQAYDDFAHAVKECGLQFDEGLLTAFFAALATKPFLILSGLSGSGKTQLGLRLGQWLGEDGSGEPRYRLVAVRPDWTGPEPLFGYEDALRKKKDGRGGWYVPPALQFMLRARANQTFPYLLVLDEMNLAHVERYFADFLSGLESREPTMPNLQEEEDGEWRLVPDADPEVPIPRNLLVIGTVNIDETTYLFSPKVLDRAMTFEFRVPADELIPNAKRPRDLAPGPSDGVRSLLAHVQDDDFQTAHPHPAQDQLAAELRSLHVLLAASGHEFGHRLYYEALRFGAMMAELGVVDSDRSLDQIVLQKLLPRVSGARRLVEPTLVELETFARGEDTQDEGAASRLPLTLRKVGRMLDLVRANQYVSFAE